MFINYIGLILECPEQDENMECPFKSLRKMPLYDSFKVWKMMDPGKKHELIEEHLKCSFTKETLKRTQYNFN